MMSDELTLLGIPSTLQMLFDLRRAVFSYGDSEETFCLSAHFVPSSRNIWIAGNESAREVLIGRSAMEIIAFLSLNLQRYPQPEKLCLIALGNRPGIGQLNWIRKHFKRRKFTLLFEDDLTGRATDIVVAAGLRMQSIYSVWSVRGIIVSCNNRSIRFRPEKLSLNNFELAFSIRTGVRTRKAKKYITFLNQLKYANS
jgi:hypothetical protein